jgi:predicted amidophosphoribosyltransferase
VEPEPAPPEPKFGGAKVTDTGPIWFACPGNGKHEEKEVEIGNCPKCGQPDYFIPYNNEFYCYKCEALFDKSSAKCPECGFVPKRLNLKHR